MYRSTPKAHKTPTLIAASPQGKKRKQSAGETSSPSKSLKVTIKQKHVVEGEKHEESYVDKFAASMLRDDVDDSDNRIEPGSHKENPEHVDDNDENEEEHKDEKKDDEMGKEFWKVHGKVDQVLHEIVPQLDERATNDLIEGNLKLVADTIEANLRDQANDPALWDVLKRKFEKSCSDDDFHSQRHDDHQEDDAPPKGEKIDAWEEETVIDEDEVIPEDETPELIIEFQNVDKRIQTIFDRARIKATLNDMLSSCTALHYYFVVINIPEEDVEPKQIILDPDDQPMWESAKTVAPTPNSAIIQLDVDDNFVINSTHLKMIWENKFDGYLRADPHDHIREFLAICDMFKYGETQSEAVKRLIFPFSLCDEAKTWFNDLNKESITSWEQMRKAFINKFFPPSLFNHLLLKIRRHGLTKGAIIQIFYHGLDEPTQGILDETAKGIFLYKSPNQAFKFLEDKVFFKHDWPIKSKNEHHRKSVSFADGSKSNTDNSRFMEKLEALTIKMNSQFQSLKEEMHEMRKNNNISGDNHDSKNDDTLICECHEVNYIQSGGYQDRIPRYSFSRQSYHDPNDPEKSLTELNNDVRNDLEDFKRRIRSMRTVYWKLFDRDDGKTTDVLPKK
ncbi:reverse transcriptase domain-containing protein [Tanacetum coccineum]